MASKHDEISKRIAKRYRGKYNPRKGVDVVTSRVAIEVETDRTINDAKRQLQGHRKPSYIAVTTNQSLDKAIKVTQGTTIGVINPAGKIVRPSSRKRRRER